MYKKSLIFCTLVISSISSSVAPSKMSHNWSICSLAQFSSVLKLVCFRLFLVSEFRCLFSDTCRSLSYLSTGMTKSDLSNLVV